MAKYIHFTEEQKQQAASVDLERFLQTRGEKLISSGREKRLASDHSITVRGNEWYDHAEERGLSPSARPDEKVKPRLGKVIGEVGKEELLAKAFGEVL